MKVVKTMQKLHLVTEGKKPYYPPALKVSAMADLLHHGLGQPPAGFSPVERRA